MKMITTPSFTLAVYAKGNAKYNRFALVLPGRCDTKDYAHMQSHVEYLADRGYFALTFDPPGTWESSGDIKMYTMTNYLKAINELIEHFGNKPTFVMGHSRGATMSMLAAIKNPHVTAFAAIMPAYPKGGYKSLDAKDWKRRGYVIEKRDLPPGGGPEIKEFKLPYSFFEDSLRYEMTQDLQQIAKPKLFILGKHDEIVPADRIRELYQTVASPKELYELDADHNYRLHKSLINEVNQIVGTFLDTYETNHI